MQGVQWLNSGPQVSARRATGNLPAGRSFFVVVATPVFLQLQRSSRRAQRCQTVRCQAGECSRIILY
jgi:hypothetical protein